MVVRYIGMALWQGRKYLLKDWYLNNAITPPRPQLGTSGISTERTRGAPLRKINISPFYSHTQTFNSASCKWCCVQCLQFVVHIGIFRYTESSILGRGDGRVASINPNVLIANVLTVLSSGVENPRKRDFKPWRRINSSFSAPGNSSICGISLGIMKYLSLAPPLMAFPACRSDNLIRSFNVSYVRRGRGVARMSGKVECPVAGGHSKRSPGQSKHPLHSFTTSFDGQAQDFDRF